jgi:uncharacterized protein YjbI with pentapeptide repeats
MTLSNPEEKLTLTHLVTQEIDLGKNKNLSGLNLSEQNLQGANLSNIVGFNLDLSRAQLVNADLTLANLTNAKLEKANLQGANLDGVILPDASNMLGANLSNARINGPISALNPETFKRNIRILCELGYYVNPNGCVTKKLRAVRKLRRQNP